MRNKLVLYLLLATLALHSVSYSKTYEIAEEDLLKVIEEKSKLLESTIKKQLDEIKYKIENISGEKTKKAVKNKSYLVDMTYTLDRDIKIYDENKKQWITLYPKGYKFNPIEYLPVLPPPIIVFNPCDKKEYEFVKAYTNDNRINYIWLSSNCKVSDMNRIIKDDGKDQPRIMFLTKEIKDRFKIEETVSIIYVDTKTKMVRVDVISVK